MFNVQLHTNQSCVRVSQLHPQHAPLGMALRRSVMPMLCNVRALLLG